MNNIKKFSLDITVNFFSYSFLSGLFPFGDCLGSFMLVSFILIFISSCSRARVGRGGRDHSVVEGLETGTGGGVVGLAKITNGGHKVAGLERLHTDVQPTAVPPTGRGRVVTAGVQFGARNVRAPLPRGRGVRT